MKRSAVKVHREISDDGIAVMYITGLVITNLGVTSADRLAQETIAQMEMPKIILNLADVNYLDSFSFGWIMRVYKDVRTKGGEFALCCPNKDILYMLKLTEFTRIVPVYHSEKDARGAMKTGNQSKRITYI